MGFDGFELGVSSASFRLDKVRSLAEKLGARFCSVHNVVSERRMDDANRRGSWLSSVDEDKRRTAVSATLETVRLARELGAGAVVIHAGRIEGFGSPVSHVLLAERTSGGSRAAVDAMLSRRREAAAPAMEAACRSLSELCERVGDLALCLENPYFYYEIPLLDEVQTIFDRLRAPNLFYWHDFGHAHVFQLIGLCLETDWLDRYSDRLYGTHIHDAIGIRDHRPPGYGEIDLARLLARTPARALRVIEVGSQFAADEVRSGLRLVQTLGRP